jgi:hypothetical protein
MAGVFGYGVTTDVLIAGGRARFLYVVRAETPEEAYRIVRQTVSEGSDVGETCYPLSEETAERMNLAPGQARRL